MSILLDICDYFIELKSKIDFVYAKQQLKDKERANYDQLDATNLAWLETIDKINYYEKKCLKNSQLLKQITILFDSNRRKLFILTDQHISKETIKIYFKNKSITNLTAQLIKCKLFNDKFAKIASHCHETTLDLQHLKHLDFSSHRILNINSECFNEFSSLETLFLNTNELISINCDTFKSMTNLISLDLSYNCLTKICLKGLSYLEYLNLTGNKLVTISNDSFSDMYNLKKLILRCNQLECLNDTAFKCLNKLEHLDLSWNKLSSTNCIECLSSSLLELNLSHNKLSSLEANVLSSLVNLEKLNLDCNLIKSFYLCGNNSRLCILSLAFNQIISIDTNTLNRLTKLKELNLYANPIDVSNY